MSKKSEEHRDGRASASIGGDGERMKELALGLYSRGVLSIGKATEVAGISRHALETLIAERHVIRPFDAAELESDLAWAAKDH